LRAVIFANGILVDPDRVNSLLQPNDYIIAADGGAQHCQEIGLRPDIVIGDMDSISPELKTEYQAGRTEFIIHPKDKDQTDLDLALSLAKQKEINEVLLFGILGGRLDLSLANLLLLARDEWHNMSLVVVNGPDQAFLLRSNCSNSINGKPGDIVSLIPLTEQVEGVSTRGLRWQLEDAVLQLGNTRSLSNEMENGLAQVTIKQGKLLMVHRSIQIDGPEE